MKIACSDFTATADDEAGPASCATADAETADARPQAVSNRRMCMSLDMDSVGSATADRSSENTSIR